MLEASAHVCSRQPGLLAGQWQRPMWPRLRLDLGWADLARGFWYALFPGNRGRAQLDLEAAWSAGANDALACLSVRSGFDLLLRALALPEGSEVLFSALTIPDMPAIAGAHGLVAVPVDLQDDFQLDPEAVRAALGPRSRVLVNAHLFGVRPDGTDLYRLAREHGLYAVEDCAQAWAPGSWRGSQLADASLFSFGPIKTATTLGGALCRIEDPALLARMRDIQGQQPAQPVSRVLAKLGKYALLKLISIVQVFGLIVKLNQWRGKSVDELLRGLARSFAGRDLLGQIRRQATPGTLRWLRQRTRNYDAARIAQRVRNAAVIAGSGDPGTAQPSHVFWLFPFTTSDPASVRERLWAHGFDSAIRGSLEVVSAPAGRTGLDCPVARRLLEHTVFLPCYPELPLKEINRMHELLAGA